MNRLIAQFSLTAAFLLTPAVLVAAFEIPDGHKPVVEGFQVADGICEADLIAVGHVKELTFGAKDDTLAPFDVSEVLYHYCPIDGFGI